MTIKELCKTYNITQSELSRRFSIPLRTVQQWHAGDRTPPAYIVALIEDALNHPGTIVERRTLSASNLRKCCDDYHWFDLATPAEFEEFIDSVYGEAYGESDYYATMTADRLCVLADKILKNSSADYPVTSIMSVLAQYCTYTFF